MKKLIYLFLLFTFQIQAQEIPIGTWRTHHSYESGQLVSATNSKIYCASTNGLFFLDLEDNSINKFSKIDGLSDVTISSMQFNTERNILLIGYSSGNIDLVTQENISNIDLIVAENISEDKEIKDISFFENNAYLASEFGIIVIDLDQISIQEVYREIGPDGETLEVYATSIYQDSLFAITDQGLIKASLLSNSNLLDFANWTLVEETRPFMFNKIESNDNSIYLANDSSIYSIRGNILESVYSGSLQINQIKSLNGQLHILTEESLLLYDNPGISLISYAENTSPNDILAINNEYWIADDYLSLVKFNGSTSMFKPNGPISDIIDKLAYHSDSIFSLGPYRDNNFVRANNNAYSVFNNGLWENIKNEDFSDISGDSPNFSISYGDGILDKRNNEVITDSNSTLELSGDNLLITSTHETTEGFWFSNYGVDNSLHVFEEDTWTSYNISFRFPEKILSAANGKLIISSAPFNSGGLLTFDPTDQSRQIINTTLTELPSNVINDFEIDLDDELWIATNGGVVYLPSAGSDIFSGFNEVITPIFENSFLFAEERINCIEVDPGNRKWMGTSQGAWLFEESGQSLVHHFTKENSPLPSNNVQDIVIHPESGEVFISTDKGMVSYRSDATRSSPFHQEVAIYPNPASSYSGNIGVTGLATDVRVKITDISGKLIREIEANGGAIQWDQRDYNGTQAESGVYLFFSSNGDGSETFIGKLLIVN